MFHTRIELRQIGVRDETKLLGGVGVCGRELCCHSYLSEFQTVSIRMAKEQNLSLNPTKISGICGRLMCCLNNEQATYEYLNSQLPQVGERVTVREEGTKGIVQSVNVLRQTVRVIETTMLDTSDLEALEAAFKPNTKMVYFEAVANPTLRVTDIAAVAEIAHKHGAIVVVDNTFTPPPVCRPLTLGADIVLHSMTKYLNGHGDVIAGVIAGKKETISAIVSKCVGKLTGSELAPIASYMVIRGLKTLDVRMKVHSASAKAMAEYLEKQPYIKAVYHPTLPSNGKNYETAKKQFREGYCTGMITFETAKYKGMSEYEVARKLLDNLQIPGLGVSLGGADSLIQLPTAMTHAKVPAEGKKAAGITDGMVRFSVGLENIEDLIADFEQAAAKL